MGNRVLPVDNAADELSVHTIEPFVEFSVSDSRTTEIIEHVDLDAQVKQVTDSMSSDRCSQTVPCDIEFGLLEDRSIVLHCVLDCTHNVLIIIVEASMHLAAVVAESVLRLEEVYITYPVF